MARNRTYRKHFGTKNETESTVLHCVKMMIICMIMFDLFWRFTEITVNDVVADRGIIECMNSICYLDVLTFY